MVGRVHVPFSRFENLGQPVFMEALCSFIIGSAAWTVETCRYEPSNTPCGTEESELLLAFRPPMASPTCFALQLQQRCGVHTKAARLECECHEVYMKVRHDVFQSQRAPLNMVSTLYSISFSDTQMVHKNPVIRDPYFEPCMEYGE